MIYARQAYHGPEAAGQLVVSRADPAQLLDPAETSLDDISLSIAGLIKDPRSARARFSLQLASGNDRLHAVLSMSLKVVRFSSTMVIEDAYPYK